MSKPIERPYVKPSWEAIIDDGKFFAEVKDEDGEVTGKKMIRFVRAVVIVTTSDGGKMFFAKSNRGKSYRDSREKTKRIDETEVQSELARMLGDSWEAARAFDALQV